MKHIQLFLLIPFLLTACGPNAAPAPGEQGAQSLPPAELKIDEPTREKIQKLKEGSTKRELILALGKPEGEMLLGDTEIYYFHGVEIKLKNGGVVEIPENLEAALQAGVQKKREQAESDLAKNVPAKNQNIRNGGKEVDLKSLVGKGSITIVDFYADWCGPCKSAEPQLKKLAEDPRVNLIQIDIVNWSSPVASQYQLRGIPNMRVFDAEGKLLGKPTHSVPQIRKYVQKAL